MTATASPPVKDSAFAEAFGKVLAGLLKERKLGESAFARACGLSVDAIAHYCAGRREPSYTAVRKIARALGLTIGQFDKLLPPVDAPAAKKEKSDDA